MTGVQDHWSSVSPDPPLHDEMLRLRRWEVTDIDCIAAAGTDRRITDSTSIPAAFTSELAVEYVKRQWARQANEEALSLAIASADDNVAVGFVGLMRRPQPGTVGLGYWVISRARSGGFATRSAQLLTRWALGTGNVRRIEAWVEPDNEASQRVLLNAGFSFEGRLRSALVLADRRADALSYSLLPSDRANGSGW